MANDSKRTSSNWKAAGLGAAAGAVGILALLGLTGLAVVYTGAYNIAATEEHTSFTRWAFDTTFRTSIEQRAAGLQAPQKPTAAMIEAGASEYKAMCEQCHGGPGARRADWASGMRPRPPHLTEAAGDWQEREVFWLVKHGAKMTGMPAFGPTHDDQTLWNIAAFVKALPGMTSERYAALGGAHQHGSGQKHGSDAKHGDGHSH